VRANQGRTRLQAMEGMLQVPVPDRSGTNDKRAVSNCVGDRIVFFSVGQHVRGADGGASALKCYIVWIDHPKIVKSKVAHRSSGRSDVEGISRIHQDYAQVIDFSWRSQGISYSTAAFIESALPRLTAPGVPPRCKPLAAPAIRLRL